MAENGAVKVAINGLSFYYGNFQALNNITLPLYRNKVTAFIGPSGCGKSTLLRVLNRIYELYPNQRAEGEVLLDGQNILSGRLDLNQLRAKVGMVFQKPTPFPMTIFDNIAFGLQLHESVPRSELDGRVEHALRRAALEQLRAQLDAADPMPTNTTGHNIATDEARGKWSGGTGCPAGPGRPRPTLVLAPSSN